MLAWAGPSYGTDAQYVGYKAQITVKTNSSRLLRLVVRLVSSTSDRDHRQLVNVASPCKKGIV